MSRPRLLKIEARLRRTGWIEGEFGWRKTEFGFSCFCPVYSKGLRALASSKYLRMVPSSIFTPFSAKSDLI